MSTSSSKYQVNNKACSFLKSRDAKEKWDLPLESCYAERSGKGYHVQDETVTPQIFAFHFFDSLDIYVHFCT